MPALTVEPTLGALTLPHFLVKQLKPEKHGLHEADLVQAIQEIEIQTQIYGASFIIVHIIDSDPLWRITNSGLIKVQEDGLLNELVVEFPEGTGYQWRLCKAEGNTILAQATLILTFEDMVVQRLREQWGHKTAQPGLTTRAQFVKVLVEEANHNEHLHPPIKFVSPGQNRKEPVAEAKPSKTKTAAASAKAKEEKERGIHAGAEFKIKGLPPSPTQRAILNEAMSIAGEHNAGPLAVEAMVETMIDENTVSNSGEGLFQVEPATASSKGVTKGNVKSEVEGFLLKGYAINEGAIEYAKKNPTAAAYEVAQAIQGSGAGKASKGKANYGQFQQEAQEVIHAFGGVRGGGTTPTSTNESDVGQLSRGAVGENPDEDSWECIQRLAKDVRWFAFTDGRNRLYYMDGPDLRSQRPVCYINPTFKLQNGEVTSRVVKEDKGGQRIEELGALIAVEAWTFDNTTFEYQSTHKARGKVQRRSKISKPQTPSEVRIKLLCGITEYRAGDVFVFQGGSPISENSGRWIVADVTRETMKQPYSKIILVPPTEPLPEPKAAGTTTPSPVNAGEQGSALAAFNASNDLSTAAIPYLWGGGHKAGSEISGGPPEHGLDCSGSVCWVLVHAGFPAQPGGNFANGAATSGQLETWGEAGEGKEMTLWASPNHTYLEFKIPGHEPAQLNTNGKQGGPRLYTLSQGGSYNGEKGGGSGGPFVARHAKGT